MYKKKKKKKKKISVLRCSNFQGHSLRVGTVIFYQWSGQHSSNLWLFLYNEHLSAMTHCHQILVSMVLKLKVSEKFTVCSSKTNNFTPTILTILNLCLFFFQKKKKPSNKRFHAHKKRLLSKLLFFFTHLVFNCDLMF